MTSKKADSPEAEKCYRKMCSLLVKGRQARWKSPENIERWMEIRKRRVYVKGLCFFPMEARMRGLAKAHAKNKVISEYLAPLRKAVSELATSVIRYHRLAKGITQKRMTSLIGVNLSTYVLLESGKQQLTLQMAFTMAKILGISINHFMLNPKGNDLNMRMRVLEKAGVVQKRVSTTRKRERSVAEEVNKNRRRSEAYFATSADQERSSLKDIL